MKHEDGKEMGINGVRRRNAKRQLIDGFANGVATINTQERRKNIG